MNVFLAPAAASNITANVNSTCLLLSWQQPDGDLDSLVVALSTNGTGFWETTLPPDATEVAVDQLTPGSAYQVVVTSRSGELTNQSETSVRTGEVFSFGLSFPFLPFTLIVPSLSRFQLQQQRPAFLCLPPPLVDFSCLGHAPVVTGMATGCNSLTVLCR